MHQVDQCCLVAADHPVEEEVLGPDGGRVEMEPAGEPQGFPGLLVGVGDAVGARVGLAGGDLPLMVRGVSEELGADVLLGWRRRRVRRAG